ncbi:MAG: hypothetical protein DMD48_08860 [Gemmatimonadetes bacterium]|nr:MAG: hypothetical protein DMD48_08860 [Gemmatimonadota bacterium]
MIRHRLIVPHQLGLLRGERRGREHQGRQSRSTRHTLPPLARSLHEGQRLLLNITPQMSFLHRSIEPRVAANGGRSGFRLLPTGLDAFVARAVLIELAEQTLDLQYYIFHADTTGALVIDRLIAAADRGVRVRVLLDDWGTLEKKDEDVAGLDAHPNIEIRVFNPYVHRSGLLRLGELLTSFTRVNTGTASSPFRFLSWVNSRPTPLRSPLAGGSSATAASCCRKQHTPAPSPARRSRPSCGRTPCTSTGRRRRSSRILPTNSPNRWARGVRAISAARSLRTFAPCGPTCSWCRRTSYRARRGWPSSGSGAAMA